MRTTLKRGVGRTGGSNGRNGHAVYPPSTASSVVRYRQAPRRRTALGLIGKILLVALLTLVAVVVAVAGGAFLWFHETVRGMRAHTEDVKIAQKQLNVSLPGVDRQVAQSILDGAHQTCPYSKATRGNIEVQINLIETGTTT